MNYQHTGLTPERWFMFSLIEQLANIGSEVERTISWKKKGNAEYSLLAFYRALELIDLSIKDPKNRMQLKEIVRVREALADHFVFDNEYNSTPEIWQKYFLQFAYAARVNR